MREAMMGAAAVFAMTCGGAWAQDAPAPVVAQARAAIREVLNDPESARFKNEEVMPNGAVCGEVNARNSLGGYVGFRPFAVDASLGLARIHQPSRDVQAGPIKVLAICHRDTAETLRSAQLRWVEQAMAEHERKGLESCRGRASSKAVPPAYDSAEACANLSRDTNRWLREDMMALVEKE